MTKGPERKDAAMPEGADFPESRDARDYKDLFSTQAADYAKFRPTYPPELFRYLAAQAPDRELAWDVGTGSGQAAVELARDFRRVRATDPTDKQLASAVAEPEIDYANASADRSGLPAASVDLITVAQAFHWFAIEEFYAEARRVAKPGALLAIWSYSLCEITPAVDAAVWDLYRNLLGPYWEKERRLVEEGYRNCPFPFARMTPPEFQMRAEWGLAELVGYLGTWSALQTYRRMHPAPARDPLEAAYPALKRAWGDAETRPVRWPLAVMLGRV